MRHQSWALLAVPALLILASLLLLLGLGSGSRRFVDSDQLDPGQGQMVALEPGQPVGQTFVARHAGLAGIEFFLSPANDVPLTLGLYLRATPDAAADLATATLSLPAGASPGFYRFDLPPLNDSHGQYYYVFFDAPAPGISVTLAEGATYLDGAAHQGHQPLDAQTTFRLVYEPKSIVLDLLMAGVGWLGVLIVVGLLFVGPGWALLAWLWPQGKLAWAEVLGLSVGISLALYPLLLLWTDVLGLHLGSLYAWIPASGGLIALVWRYRGRIKLESGKEALQQWVHSEVLWPDLALVGVLGLVFGLRLLVVRSLDAPMWGDSYQHTMIVQLLLDHGGLFDSWLPYVPLKSFTYHYGFHTAVALYHWLTGADILGSVLTIGQVLNGLAVLSLYPLALKLTGSRWAGVLTVLVAGLVSPMPMYYANWGRYVQLTGQVVLPVAIWLTLESIGSRQRRLGLWILTGFAVAGLGLAHYRVFIYYLLFLPVAWAGSTFKAWKEKQALRTPLLRLILVLSVALAFSLPWIWRLGSGYLLEILGEFSRSSSSTSATPQSELLLKFDFFIPEALLAVALVGVVVGLLRRQFWTLLVAAWVALLFLAANPNWLGLPGATTVSNFAGVLNNGTVLMSLYMPVSILCGYLGSTLIEALPERVPWLRRAAAVGLILVLAVPGAKRALTIVDVHHVLVTRPDLQAMQWIKEQTEETSKFLANSFFAYDDNVIVGSDAGWWLPLLAHRQNTVPPITYGHETAYDPDYIAHVNDLARYVATSDLGAAETVEILKNADITHVFVGQTGGNLSWQILQESEIYELVYHKDRVWIFEIR